MLLDSAASVVATDRNVYHCRRLLRLLTAAELSEQSAMSAMPLKPSLAARPLIALRSAARLCLIGSVAIGCAVAGPYVGSSAKTVMAAIFAASLTSSIAGFAFSAICGAMLFHPWDDPIQVVQVMMACSTANQAMMTWELRHDIRWSELGVFLAGGAAGLPLGVWVLLHADRHLYTRGLGIFLLAYGAYMLFAKLATVTRQHAGFDLASGFVGGITGGAAGFPDALVTIWCGLRGWDKLRQRALFQPFILIMQIAALPVIGVLRQQAGQEAGLNPANLLCILAVLFGTSLGMACFRKMSNRQFALAVNALLIVSGLSHAM